MTNPTALIVDDEADIRELLEITLGRMGIDTESAEDVGSAKALLSDRRFDLCLTDMRLPDGRGLEIVQYIQAQRLDIPVAVITAHGNTEDAVASLKNGAFDFVTKPVDVDALRQLVDTALKVSRPAEDHRPDRPALFGKAESIQALRRTVVKLARSQAPVHIHGESGTGKELVARMIHSEGPRREAPFVPVNCGAIPTELMESEFFGHRKGSFTGAGADKIGLFQAAGGGTLFLDEVADLPMPMQVKLLRAIQERAIRVIGDTREQHIDVRIISATHHDLKALVASGEFREDLYYRLNVIEVTTPPLRERREDIPGLAELLLAKIARHHGCAPPTLHADAIQALCGYGFPGNVRELENILERALTLCESNAIHTDDLGLPQETDATAREEPKDASTSIEDDLAQIERNRILAALEQTRFNKTRAAELLGISFRSLRYRLKKLKIEP